MSKTQNTPTLARNTPFAHLGAFRGCYSVLLYVHMAKTRHSRHVFGRKTARKRQKCGSEDIISCLGLADPDPVAFRSFPGRISSKYAPRLPVFGLMNI
jgi:hypothetical protein